MSSRGAQSLIAALFVVAIATALAAPVVGATGEVIVKPPIHLPPMMAKPHLPLPVSPTGVEPQRPCMGHSGDGVFLSGRRICLYEIQNENGISIVGDVIDEENWHKTIEGATITFWIETLPEPLTTVTDQWGQWAFVDVPGRPSGATCYAFRVEAPGYKSWLDPRGSIWPEGWYLEMSLSRNERFYDNLIYKEPERCIRYDRHRAPTAG